MHFLEFASIFFVQHQISGPETNNDKPQMNATGFGSAGAGFAGAKTTRRLLYST